MNLGPSQNQRLSEVLRQLAAEDRAEIRISELLDLLGERAFGAGILAFAVPSIIPGASAIFAIPLFFITAQLMIGRPTMWLPASLAQRSIAWNALRKGLGRATELVSRAERLMKPRLDILCTPFAERLTGIACFALTLILFLPIPFANFPPALALVLFALGLAEQDGVAVAIGWFLSLVTLFIALGVGYGIIAGGFYLGRWLFGF
ncbi:MAG: exopolysaccharide biosynthesis protein [Rhizobiales bacterium]|nr:exopolysaccharide biosynthesis protein [Hyphomicrobiales bacterium]